MIHDFRTDKNLFFIFIFISDFVLFIFTFEVVLTQFRHHLNRIIHVILFTQ